MYEYVTIGDQRFERKIEGISSQENIENSTNAFKEQMKRLREQRERERSEEVSSWEGYTADPLEEFPAADLDFSYKRKAVPVAEPTPEPAVEDDFWAAPAEEVEAEIHLQFGDARLPSRFWKRCQELTSGCWLYDRKEGVAPKVGVMFWEGKTTRVNRLVYRLFLGEPNGNVTHRCANVDCVNPAHMAINYRPRQPGVEQKLNKVLGYVSDELTRHATDAKIAQALGFSVRSTKKYLRELRARGLIAHSETKRFRGNNGWVNQRTLYTSKEAQAFAQPVPARDPVPMPERTARQATMVKRLKDFLQESSARSKYANRQIAAESGLSQSTVARGLKLMKDSGELISYVKSYRDDDGLWHRSRELVFTENEPFNGFFGRAN